MVFRNTFKRFLQNAPAGLAIVGNSGPDAYVHERPPWLQALCVLCLFCFRNEAKGRGTHALPGRPAGRPYKSLVPKPQGRTKVQTAL